MAWAPRVCTLLLPLIVGGMGARAAEAPERPVAVLDLRVVMDSWEHGRLATEQLRAAAQRLRGGPTGPQLCQTLSQGQEARLEAGRKAMERGRELLESGRYAEALASLDSARQAHTDASSALCRLPEMADVHGWTAATLLRLARREEAAGHAMAAEEYYPRWYQDRGYGLSAEEEQWFLATALDRGVASARVRPELRGPAEKLSPAWLVVGELERRPSSSLELNLRILGSDGQVAGAVVEQPAAGLTATDPTWERAVRALLVQAEGEAQALRPAPPPATPSTGPGRWLGWSLGGLALTGAGVAAWLLWPEPAPPADTDPRWTLVVESGS